MPERKRRLPRLRWIVLAAAVVILVPAAILGVPILAHQNAGLSHQVAVADTWPHRVTAEGDDGRTRTLEVAASVGGLDTSTLAVGQRIVVSGSGYDGGRGIYVAICKIPPAGEKPGPCIGGVPDQKTETTAAGSVQYAASNWINDDWAWKLFGARSYDSIADGTFTAYLEVGEPVADALDCTVVACGLFTRNDHTALSDRVQDLYVPVEFAAH